MVPRRLSLPRRRFPKERTGASLRSAYLTLTYGPSPQGGVAVVVSKKVAKKAVDRHRIKRRLLTLTRPYARTDMFFVLYPKAQTLALPFRVLKEEVDEVFMKTRRSVAQ